MLMNLYVKSKTSVMATVICGIKNIHFLLPRFLVLLHVESHQSLLVLVQQSVLGGDIKTIKAGRSSAIISYVSEKQSIVYTSACIESAIIEQYHSDKKLYENCSRHSWNEVDDAFDHQLD